MAKKNPSMPGRPKGSRLHEPILEEKVILAIMDKLSLTFKEYWEMYMDNPGLETRAKMQRVPTEDGSLELLPIDEVETTDSYVSQGGFREWFTKRGLKLHRMVNMLSLLNLKFVIVPYRSQVTVKVNDSEVTVSDIGKEDIALFSIDEREDMPKLTYESIELPKAKVVLRKARTTPTKEERTQDKSDNN